MKVFQTLITILLFPIFLIGQTKKIDSLRNELTNPKRGINYIELLNDICYTFLPINLDSSESYCQKAKDLAEKESHKNGLWKAQYNLGIIECYRFENESAIDYLDEALNIGIELKDSIKIAESILIKGTVLSNLGKFDSALFFLQRALDIGEIFSNDRIIGKAAGNMCGIYSERRGDFKKAMELLIKAVNAFEKTGNRRHLAVGLCNIAYINTEFDRFEEALEGYKNALELANQLTGQRLEGSILNHIGVVHKELKQFEKSEQVFLECIKINSEINSYQQLASCHDNLGLLYMDLGKNEKAFFHLNKCLEITENKGLPMNNQLTIYINLGDYYGRIKEMSKSLYFFNKAIEICSENDIEFSTSKMEIYRNLSKVLKENNFFEESIAAYEKFQMIKDTIYETNLTSTIFEMRTKYETEKKEEQLVKERALTQLQALQIQNNQLGLIGALAFIAFLGFGFFTINKTNKRLTLETNKSETLLKEVQHRVKNNLMFVASLLDLQSMSISNAEAQKVVEEGRDRVEAMGLLHQKLLYQDDEPTIVNMKEYLEELLQVLKSSFQNLNQQQLIFDIEPIKLDLDKAMPIGLIVNELVNNAFKHATKGNAFSKVNISLIKKNKIELVIEDNGKGFSDDFDISKTNSFGLKLVELLSRQIEGKLKISNELGARFELIF